MRLLNVIRSVDPVHGGPAEGLRQSVMASRLLGHSEEVVTLDAPGAACVRDFPVTTFALGPASGNFGFAAALVPWLKANVEGYDAVVVHGLWQYQSLAVWRALRGGPVPYFVYPHGMLDPWFRQAYPLKHFKKSIYWSLIERRVLRDAGAVLFTASEEARLAMHTFTPCEINPAVVGYGVALADAARQVSADVFFQAWPETRGRRIVLFLGRLHPKKGGDLLIDAFAKVLESQPLSHLVMAGPDDGAGTRAALQAQAARLGMGDRVTFTGMLSGDLKWSALQAAEVFVLPSHQENFGIAVVEALAMGVPVLISDKVNIWREIVADEAGMAEADTPDGTTKLLRRWLALDAQARLQMKLQAASCYQRHFHMSAAAQRLVDTVSSHLCGAKAAELS